MEDSPRGSRVTGRCLLEVSEHGGDVLAALEIEVCKVWRGDLTGEENGVTSRPADGSRNILAVKTGEENGVTSRPADHGGG